MNHHFNDIAVLLTWPDVPIRGDERWMMFFKKIGWVKNLNFKVGHTGIVLINHKDGSMLFYDFGRYIAPRGYGRARSSASDPSLKINLKAVVKDGDLLNINTIIEHFESMKPAMYGEGKLYFSIVQNINFNMAKSYGDSCVLQGIYPYGAIAKNNNNCSRFIMRMLMKSSQNYHFWHPINFPETIKASPISNMVNTSADNQIHRYSKKEGIISFKMTRLGSLLFLLRQLRDNFNTKRANKLPQDESIGAMKYRSKPISVPKQAIYLGGVGDGAWYHISSLENQHVLIKRYTSSGAVEYAVIGKVPATLNIKEDFEITYDSHFLHTHVLQNGQKIQIKHISVLDEHKEEDTSYLHTKMLKSNTN